jgi:tetratricopeptide (TPR) repeat protein
LRVVPGHPKATVQQALLRADDSKPDATVAALTTALFLPGLEVEDRFRALIVRASAYMAMRLPDRAISDFDAVLEIRPGWVDAIIQRAAAYVLAGRPDQAVAGLAAVSAATNVSADSRFVAAVALAEIQAQLKRGSEALAVYEAAFRLRPNNPDVAMVLGRVYLKQRRYAESVERFGVVIADTTLKPDLRAAAHMGRGGAYLGGGDKRKGVEDLKVAFDLAARDGRVARAVSDVMVRIGMLKEFDACVAALRERHWINVNTHCSRAINAGTLPKYHLGSAHYFRCSAHMAGLRYGEALDDCTMATSFRPDFTEVFHTRARIHAYLHHGAEAVRDFTTVLKQQPDHPTARMERADVLIVMQRFDEAIADFTGFIKDGRDQPAAYDKRGYAYLSKGALELALADFDAAIRLSPGTGALYIHRAMARANAGRAVEALDDVDAARRNGHRMEIRDLLNLGLAFERGKRAPLAIRYYKEALERDPGLKPARDALARLKDYQ